MLRSSLLVGLSATALAIIAGNTSSADVVPGAFIFELEDGRDPAALLSAVGQEGRTRMMLDSALFKGVSVQLNDINKAPAKAAKLASLPSVKNVWPVKLYDMPRPKVEWIGSNPAEHFGAPGAPNALKARTYSNLTTDKYSPHVMTQVDKLRAKGYTGVGIKIAIIDTGIDYKHPALGGCFGEKCLVSFGTDLVGDDYDGFNTPNPDPDPMDCAGHGSHVAGIVAAQPNKFGFSGAAPDARIGAYRVFGCNGQVSNDVLIAAYTRAFEDGAQIITASIGGPNGWSEDPWTVVVSRIVARGVPCTVSAGNEGDLGLFYASGSADGKGVTAVASFDNVDIPLLLYDVKYAIDGGADVPFGFVPGEPGAWDDVNLDVVATSLDPTIMDDACSPLPTNSTSLKNKIVLIRRGTCTFTQKATNAASQGAEYVLFYNNAPQGALSVNVGSVSSILAAGMVTADTGQAFVAALQAKKKLTLKMASQNGTTSSLVSEANNKTGGAVSTFTTWGPTWEMDLKPQVGAPGGNILSTYPLALGGYAVLSGTSMACPIAAGIVALVAQVRGTFEPALIDSLLSASADPHLFNDGSKTYGFLAPVAQQGGGLIRAFDAAFATTLVQPPGLSFNDTDHFPGTLNFTLSNTGKEEIWYNLTNVPAVTMYTMKEGSINPDPFPNDAVEGAAAGIKFSEDSVRLAPGKSVAIAVTATPPQGLDSKRLALWSGWLAVNGSDGTSLSVPYQGLTGSLHNSTVLPPEGTWMAHSADAMLRPIRTNVTFVLPAPGNAKKVDDLPALVINLAMGSPLIRADIVPRKGQSAQNMTQDHMGVKTIGQPYGFPSKWNTRGATPTFWDGRLDSGNYAPPGQFKFIVRALRIFGDAEKESEWDVSETIDFSIRYR